MRAENKSEVGRAGKDKENSEDVRAFLSQGGKRIRRRGLLSDFNSFSLLFSRFSSLPVRKMPKRSKMPNSSSP
jgi:hypothetical protein